MKTLKILTLMLAATLLLGAAQALAATDTETLVINANVVNAAKLTLGTGTITFPDSDPDTVPLIAATENSVSVSAKARTGASGISTLTVLVGTDLTSATSDTIAIGNVTLDRHRGRLHRRNHEQGDCPECRELDWPGEQTGTFSYSLANSWAYPVGNLLCYGDLHPDFSLRRRGVAEGRMGNGGPHPPFFIGSMNLVVI